MSEFDKLLIVFVCTVAGVCIFIGIPIMATFNNTQEVTMTKHKPKHTLQDLFKAIAKVETNGKLAKGDFGEIGTYQITKSYWQDAKMPYGQHEWCWNDKYSQEVMVRYWHRYVPIALSQFGFEALCNVHNGGPNGWRDDPEWFVQYQGYTLERAKQKIANVNAYWLKVKAELENSELIE